MAIWLAVFLGPLIAIGIIAAAIKGAQALLASDSVIRLLMSRPVAVVATVIMAGIGLLFAYGFFQLWESTPWAAALLIGLVLANGSAMWGLWFRHREDDAVRLPDRPRDTRGGDLAP